jgi:hypothetical protein
VTPSRAETEAALNLHLVGRPVASCLFSGSKPWLIGTPPWLMKPPNYQPRNVKSSYKVVVVWLIIWRCPLKMILNNHDLRPEFLAKCILRHPLPVDSRNPSAGAEITQYFPQYYSIERPEKRRCKRGSARCICSNICISTKVYFGAGRRGRPSWTLSESA